MIRAKINNELELRFRELAMRKFGYGKGALSRQLRKLYTYGYHLMKKNIQILKKIL